MFFVPIASYRPLLLKAMARGRRRCPIAFAWSGRSRKSIVATVFSLWDWGDAAVELLGRLVESCPASELSFADAREAAALLQNSEV
jgi:hypothetical protein